MYFETMSAAATAVGSMGQAIKSSSEHHFNFNLKLQQRTKEEYLNIQISRVSAIEELLHEVRSRAALGYSKHNIYYHSETEDTSTKYGLLFVQEVVYHLQSLGIMCTDSEYPDSDEYDRVYTIYF